MINAKPGSIPHTYWIDINSNGVFVECCVVNIDQDGNYYYFPINALDNIDKKRLLRILTGRLAPTMKCWDLMSNTTLNNGVNALVYFHQLVKVLTQNGQILSPGAGVVGTGMTGVMDTRTQEQKVEDAKKIQEARAATIAITGAP